MSAAARTLDAGRAKEFIRSSWSSSIERTLCDYIRIPNQSPNFDPAWATNGLQEQVVDLFVAWVKSQNVPGLELRVLAEQGRTPVLYIEVPGSNATSETVLLYGHMDKQPPMTADWMSGTGPYTPVIKNGKLYGRGGADDGYSLFAAISALQVLQSQSLPHARAVIMIEACEESGSKDLPHFLEQMKDKVGKPSLVVCLDSGCQNYEQLWLTTSLRGLMMGTLTVEVLTEGVHSGMASGIVPDTFRVARHLLERVESSETGKLHPVCYAAIPAHEIEMAKKVGGVVGDGIYKKFPFVGSAGPVSQDPAELVLGGTWTPTLCVTGADGLPSCSSAGNVLRPKTALRLSVRTPPSVDAKAVGKKFEEVLNANAPYGCKVSFTCDKAQSGFVANALAPWLSQSLERASQTMYGKPMLSTGEGGSIPFMGMLADMWPETQFVITGILGPSSNAHGPNEFLHIEFCQGIMGCVAQVLLDHYNAKCAAK